MLTYAQYSFFAAFLQFKASNAKGLRRWQMELDRKICSFVQIKILNRSAQKIGHRVAQCSRENLFVLKMLLSATEPTDP